MHVFCLPFDRVVKFGQLVTHQLIHVAAQGGVGYFEYLVPGRMDRRQVGQIVVRAHIQPVLPVDAKA